MTSKDKSRNEYLARINRVLEYVEHHYTESVKLETLASVASFSPFHFHRIFTVLTGETPADYFQRIRIEKAAQQLKDYPQKSISDIVFDCGFSSMALFARTFKKHFGISATDYRHSEVPLLVKDGVYYSKKGQSLSKKSKIYVALNHELCSVNLKQLIIMETKVTIKELPDMQVIYVRHTGAFDKVGEAYGKLMQFAGPRGLLASPSARTITVYHDDPSVTEISKVRQSACLTVDEDVQVNGEIGKMIVKGGKYAVGHFEIGVMEFEQAWNTMCLWLSESGYEPGEGNPMEYYYNDHTQHPEKKFILDICIPVKAL